MRDFIRKARGALGVTLTVAGAWAALGAGFALLFGILGRIPIAEVVEAASVAAGFMGVAGVTSGVVFTALLGTVYRDRRVEDLNTGVMAALGALSAVAVPAITLVTAGIRVHEGIGALLGLAVIGAIGAGTVGGIVHLAKAGESPVAIPDGDGPPQLVAADVTSESDS